MRSSILRLASCVAMVSCGNHSAPGFGDNALGGDDAGQPIFTSTTPDSGTNSTVLPSNLPPYVQDDTGKSGLPVGTISQLKMGGSSCSTTVLYPFSATMFPAQGLPPIIQWSGTATAAYVKMKYLNSNEVLYEFAEGASNPGRLTIPQAAWTALSERTPLPAQRTPLDVTLTVQTSSGMSTCQLQWYIAGGALNGLVYYNTYDDPTAAMKLGAATGGQGSVMKLTFGAATPDVFLLYTGPPAPMTNSGPCISCHSVAARGSTMVATEHDYATHTYDVFGYDIQAHPAAQPPPLNSTGIPSATFGALTPDGKYLLTMGNPQCTAGADSYPRAPNNFPLVEGPVVATLWDVAQEKAVAARGLNANYYMWMPQFSPNGDKIVFNHAKPDGNGGTDRRELATMDFDESTLTFSNLKSLYRDPGPAPNQPYTGYSTFVGNGTVPTGAGGCTQNVQPPMGSSVNQACTGFCYPGWPFFTPDSNKVIFVRTSVPDFTPSAPGTGRPLPAASGLYIVDVASGTAVAMANAIAGPNAKEIGYDYFTTVMPVAAGGQFWAFFTSKRTYGNSLYAGYPINALFGDDGGVGSLAMTYATTSPDSNKIWVSAIDIGAPPNADPSHPPFYLQGQGNSGNMRAFPALNPCKAMGQSCSSGLDCCGGSCVGEGTAARCDANNTACAQLEGACSAATPCCNTAQLCLGGFCALPSPPR